MLLWLTSDITTAPRTAMVQRLATDAGLGFVHIDYPLVYPAVLDAAQAQKLSVHWQAPPWCVGAPHASVEAFAPHGRRAARCPRHAPPGSRGPGCLRARLLWTCPRRRLPPAWWLTCGRAASQLKNAIALARATVAGVAMPTLPAPDILPSEHPTTDAPRLLLQRRRAQAGARGSPLRNLPAVAVLVHRHHFIDGSTEWLDAWLHLPASRGLFAPAAFGQQVTAQTLAEVLEMPCRMGRPRPPACLCPGAAPAGAPGRRAAAAAGALGRAAAGHTPRRRCRSVGGASDTGLPLSDVPFYLAQPEAAGAIDPVLVAAHGAEGRTSPHRAPGPGRGREGAAPDRAADQTAADKRLVAMVYNHPPVAPTSAHRSSTKPRSWSRCLAAWRRQATAHSRCRSRGWIDGLKPLLAAYYPGVDVRALLQNDRPPRCHWRVMKAAYLATLPKAVRAHERALGHARKEPLRGRLAGRKSVRHPAPADRQTLAMPQPPREGNPAPGPEPFMHKVQGAAVAPLPGGVPVGAAEADALIHFGTHGTQGMGGRQGACAGCALTMRCCPRRPACGLPLHRGQPGRGTHGQAPGPRRAGEPPHARVRPGGLRGAWPTCTR